MISGVLSSQSPSVPKGKLNIFGKLAHLKQYVNAMVLAKSTSITKSLPFTSKAMGRLNA